MNTIMKYIFSLVVLLYLSQLASNIYFRGPLVVCQDLLLATIFIFSIVHSPDFKNRVNDALHKYAYEGESGIGQDSGMDDVNPTPERDSREEVTPSSLKNTTPGCKEPTAPILNISQNRALMHQHNIEHFLSFNSVRQLKDAVKTGVAQFEPLYISLLEKEMEELIQWREVADHFDSTVNREIAKRSAQFLKDTDALEHRIVRTQANLDKYKEHVNLVEKNSQVLKEVLAKKEVDMKDQLLNADIRQRSADDRWRKSEAKAEQLSREHFEAYNKLVRASMRVVNDYKQIVSEAYEKFQKQENENSAMQEKLTQQEFKNAEIQEKFDKQEEQIQSLRTMLATRSSLSGPAKSSFNLGTRLRRT